MPEINWEKNGPAEKISYLLFVFNMESHVPQCERNVVEQPRRNHVVKPFEPVPLRLLGHSQLIH